MIYGAAKKSGPAIEHELVCPSCLSTLQSAPPSHPYRPAPKMALYACQCGFQTDTLADLVESGKARQRQTWRVVGMTKRDGLNGRGAAVEFRSKK